MLKFGQALEDIVPSLTCSNRVSLSKPEDNINIFNVGSREVRTIGFKDKAEGLWWINNASIPLALSRLGGRSLTDYILQQLKCTFHHVLREANDLADVLAREGALS